MPTRTCPTPTTVSRTSIPQRVHKNSLCSATCAVCTLQNVTSTSEDLCDVPNWSRLPENTQDQNTSLPACASHRQQRADMPSPFPSREHAARDNRHRSSTRSSEHLPPSAIDMDGGVDLDVGDLPRTSPPCATAPWPKRVVRPISASSRAPTEGDRASKHRRRRRRYTAPLRPVTLLLLLRLVGMLHLRWGYAQHFQSSLFPLMLLQQRQLLLFAYVMLRPPPLLPAVVPPAL